MVFLVSIDDSDYRGLVVSDLRGRDARFVYETDSLFITGDPAFSPDGMAVVFSAGNENPQLKSVCLIDECTDVHVSSHSDDYPLRADWRPIG